MSDWESVPAYVRVVSGLRQKIESGEIPPGEAIPSVAALARQYGVSATTVQKAIRALKAAGLVQGIAGRGVFVRNVKRLISRSADFVSPVPEGTKPPHGPSAVPKIEHVTPPDEVAELLGTEPDETVVARERIMVDDDGDAIEISTSYIPMAIAKGTPLERSAKLGGAMPSALKRLGYPPRTCKEWVTGRMPTADEAKLLKIPAGVPVLQSLRLTSTDGGRPIEVLVIVFSAERYTLEYDLPIHDA